LELKLYRLAKLEILIIREELAQKRAEAARIEGLLGDVDQRWLVVRGELLEIKETYDDARRTRIIGPQQQKKFGPEAYIIKEKTWVIITRGGRMKRQKGFSDLSAIRVPDEDQIGWVLRTDTRQTVSICTQFGSAYTLRVADIPATTGYGDPVQAAFNFKDGERIVGVLSSDAKLYRPAAEATLDQLAAGDPRPPFAIAASRQGKITRFPTTTHAEPSTKAGRKFMSLAKGDEVVLVYATAGDEMVCMATRKARVTVFDINEVPIRSGTVRGVNALRIEKSDEVLSYSLARKKREGLVTKTNRGREVIVRETAYKPVKRGGKGHIVLRLGRLVEFEWPTIVMEPHREDPAEEPQPPLGAGQ